MAHLRVYIYAVLIAATIQSCIPPSSDQIKKIDTPDIAKIKEFGITISGKIHYQFYQKYGFEDIEEQLILLVKPDNVDFLTSELPFDSLSIKRLQKIDLKKFVKNKPVNFEPEKNAQTDIRLESKEFGTRQEKPIYNNEGKYSIIINDSVESIYLFNKTTGLVYIESKKMRDSH